MSLSPRRPARAASRISAKASSTNGCCARMPRSARNASRRNAGRFRAPNFTIAASPPSNAAEHRRAARTGRRHPRRFAEARSAAMTNPAPGYLKKPEHRVDLLPESRRVRVTFAGQTIADTTEAVRCEETGHEPVQYIPEKDVRLDLMQ